MVARPSSASLRMSSTDVAAALSCCLSLLCRGGLNFRLGFDWEALVYFRGSSVLWLWAFLPIAVLAG